MMTLLLVKVPPSQREMTAGYPNSAASSFTSAAGGWVATKSTVLPSMSLLLRKASALSKDSLVFKRFMISIPFRLPKTFTFIRGWVLDFFRP